MSIDHRRRRSRRQPSPLAAITTESLAILGCCGLVIWTSGSLTETAIDPLPKVAPTTSPSPEPPPAKPNDDPWWALAAQHRPR